MPRSAAPRVKRACGSARVDPAAFAIAPSFAWRRVFFTVETLSTMALRATAEGGAPKARQ
jgi:hypothetical protein